MTRRRLRKNINFPQNLYVNHKDSGSYYSYRHPITKKYFSLGSDKSRAFSASKILNDKLNPVDDLVSRIIGDSQVTMGFLIDRFKSDFFCHKKIASSTRKNTDYRLNRLDVDLGAKLVSNITVMDIADYLDSNHVNEAYTKHRALLIELFRFSITKGYRTDNPVLVTYPKHYDKSRNRLTLEQFKAIYWRCDDFMKIAMELSLITLQGRSEICNMKFSDVQDGYLYVVRNKSKKLDHAFIRIALTPAIKNIIYKARNSGILSPYIVHREPFRRTSAKDRSHWTQLTLSDFTHRFRDFRDITGLFDSVPRKNRPTFHEIRALGSWCYEKAGYDRSAYVQKLMAHADEKMTAGYQSGHEQTWTDVNADLTFEMIFN